MSGTISSQSGHQMAQLGAEIDKQLVKRCNENR